MARLRRRWRVAKWAGAAFSVALLAALVSSLCCGISYSTAKFTPRTTAKGGLFYDVEHLRYFNLCNGCLVYSHSPKTQAIRLLSWAIDTKSPCTMTWTPFYHSDPGLFGVGLPLWMPLLLVAIPTAMLFLRDRRPPPHCCQGCGYDLTGNTSGRCSECGAKTGGCWPKSAICGPSRACSPLDR